MAGAASILFFFVDDELAAVAAVAIYL